MTIRKLWLGILGGLVLVSIGINTIILSFLTDRYYQDYMLDTYNEHVGQIIDYSTTALENGETDEEKMELILETHLIDPIVQIKLYTPEGSLMAHVTAVSISENTMNDMMDGNRMGDMMNGSMMDQESDESDSGMNYTSNGSGIQTEVEQYEITQDNEVIGVLNITRTATLEQSGVAKRFKASLFRNSSVSMGISILIAIVVAIVFSRWMSQSLIDTSMMAQQINAGDDQKIAATKIHEVNAIRESLQSLQMRLKLRQKSRQALVDELTHQARTPLTILKTHLEGIEDGMLEMNQEEVDIFMNQVENLSLMIQEMGKMIDAESSHTEPEIKKVEMTKVLQRIVRGLKAQFDRKEMTVNFDRGDKIWLATDPFKLSQSIYNILINAYKYCDWGNQVSLTYGQKDKMVWIEIKDTGKGIDANEIDKVFNAYYRGEKNRHIQGEGIGLFIVKENIEALHGKVKVDSKPNQGTRFRIELPQNFEEKSNEASKEV